PGSNVTVKPVFTGKSGGSSEGGGTTTESKLPFKDVKGHWAYDAIKYACEKKLMNGVSDTKFSPDGTLTRGMMATLLYRLEGEPRVSGAAFSDIGTDMWYTKAITWAADNKIVNGYGDGVFAPNDNITREQLAAI